MRSVTKPSSVYYVFANNCKVQQSQYIHTYIQKCAHAYILTHNTCGRLQSLSSVYCVFANICKVQQSQYIHTYIHICAHAYITNDALLTTHAVSYKAFPLCIVSLPTFARCSILSACVCVHVRVIYVCIYVSIHTHT